MKLIGMNIPINFPFYAITEKEFTKNLITISLYILQFIIVGHPQLHADQ